MRSTRSPAPPPAAVERAVRELYQKTYGDPPARTVLAPGRVELLGNHTDYNQGLVLAAAVDRATALAVAPRKDGRIALVSSAVNGRVEFPLDRIAPDPEARWADYVKGVLRELQARGVHFTGFNAAIATDIPLGAGLASSAALTVATALAVRALHPYRLTVTGLGEPPARDPDGLLPPLTVAEKLETARLCLAAETRFVGLQCGLLDQVTCLFGKAQQAIELDCLTFAVEPVPMPGEFALILCPSGVQHALVDGDYNALRAECEGAARALGVKSLRALDARSLAARQDRLTPRQFECARHVVGEIQRVVAGTRALREGDLDQFGQYLLQSHESSRDLFRNSCPELDLLVELARAHPGCLGARLTGGGFGGATLNLVRAAEADAFVAHMTRAWEEQRGTRLQPLRCRMADGAR